MAGIALPALSIRPPQQQEGPLDQYSRLMQIRNLMTQGQLGQQEVQQRGMQNQMTQMDLQAHQAFAKALADTNGDYDKAFDVAEKQYGANPLSLMPMRQGILKYKQDRLGYNEHQQAFEQAQNDLLQGAYDAVTKAPPEQKAQVYQQQIQQLQRMGVQGTQQMPQQYPGDEAFAAFGPVLKAHSKMTEDAFKQAETQKNTAQAGEAAQAAEQKQRANAAGMLAMATNAQDYAAKLGALPPSIASAFPAQWSPNLRRQILQAGMTPSEASTAEQGAQRVAIERGQLGVAQGRLAEEKRKNTLLYGDMTPGSAGQQGLVDLIGQGKAGADRLMFLVSKNPQLLQEVAAKYPDFDVSKVKGYTDAVKAFTSGPESDQLTAGSVLLQHLKQLKDINDQNPVEVRVPGTKAYNAFHNLLDTLADEKATFYGEPKTNEAIGATKSTLGSLVNRDAAITEQAKAMGVRLDELEAKWKKAAPSKAYEAKYPGITAEAEQARASLDPGYAQRGGARGGQTKPGAPQVGQQVTIRGKTMKVTAVHPDGSFDAQ